MKIYGLSAIVSNDKPQAIGELWEYFMNKNIAHQINHKVNDDIIAVYCRYQGDFTKPYTLIIGCAVSKNDPNSTMDSIDFDLIAHKKYDVTGKIPEAVFKKWQEIWASGMARSYDIDCEIYKSDGTVEIFVK